MGLEVYYPTDIRNALLAAEQAATATAEAAGNEDDPFTAAFLVGYRAALTTLALAFGLVPDGGKELLIIQNKSLMRDDFVAAISQSRTSREPGCRRADSTKLPNL